MTAPGFTEAQPMLIFFWPCFTLVGLTTCSIQSSSRESSRQHKPRSESQQSRGMCGHHWFHGVSLSPQALFKITKVAAERFWTFVSLWFLLRLHYRCHEHSPQKLPNNDPRNSRGRRPQEVETSMRSLCPEISLFRQLDFALFRQFQLLYLVDDEGPEAHLRIADWPVTPSLLRPLCLCLHLHLLSL